MFLVSGLINLETTVRVDEFPIAYAPVRYPFFGVRSTVSGVGYNVTKALTTLGHGVRFLSLIGADAVGGLVRETLRTEGLPGEDVLPTLAQTAQSVILYDEAGQRQINVDLKDLQERPYPMAQFQTALEKCELAVLCNINFSRPMLLAARLAGKWIATDVHTIRDLEDDYNRDFMQQADILFMSHEQLPVPPAEWAAAVHGRYGNEIIVIGMGAQGAWLRVKRTGFSGLVPGVKPPRPIVNTIGAGDALFAAFLHTYRRTRDPHLALRHAQHFAAWKIGSTGAAEGFVGADELESLAS